MNYVLLFGSEYDPHIQLVHSKLLNLGSNSIIFDINNNNHLLSLGFNNAQFDGVLKVYDQIIGFEEISNVWWRNKPNPYIGDDIDQKAIRDFISTEWRSLLNILYKFTPNSRWINSPLYQYQINYKSYQLWLAQKVGFLIPQTLISNDVDSIISHFKNHNRLIYKQVGWSMFPNGDVIFTNEVDKMDLEHNHEKISVAPGTFQELLDKEYELRITVIGDVIYSVKINSQQSEITSVDWRHDQLSYMYEPYTIDTKLKKLLLEFNSLAGISYGAYDIVKTKSGQYIFLECNPSGQWLWIEEKVKSYKVTDALVELLIS
ncbi:hypothetical protein [Bacillus thuringiensis]|uniref:hypothetical protein n=1 Tax=Bacillus thuringiensis TaxID=1428 RepID=UPI000BF8EDDD|nr:hypothetical protein [Bacillus thuringiensis]MCU5743736.1 hypothetical protein [Bacillus cereus]PFU61989.1 hypothetical protein COK85_10275 [Bacillus thuringiensis]